MASLATVRLISMRLSVRKLVGNHSALDKKSSTLLLDYFAHQQQISFFGKASADTWRLGTNEITGKNHAEVQQQQQQLVYDGTMNQMIWRVKQFSLFTSAAILFSQPLLWGELAALNNVILQVIFFVGVFKSENYLAAFWHLSVLPPPKTSLVKE